MKYPFESHVEVHKYPESLEGEAIYIAHKHDFRVSTFSDADRTVFINGRGKQYGELSDRMSMLILDLHTRGFKIKRYKIEEVLMDSKEKDHLQVCTP